MALGVLRSVAAQRWAESQHLFNPSTAHTHGSSLLMDRRHWMLLGFALACVAGLLLWIGEIDLGMEESIAPPNTPSTAPAAPAQP